MILSEESGGKGQGRPGRWEDEACGRTVSPAGLASLLGIATGTIQDRARASDRVGKSALPTYPPFIPPQNPREDVRV